MVHQVVALHPSVYQHVHENGTPCVSKGLNLSMYEAKEPVNGHRQPNTVAAETRLTRRTLHTISQPFEHAGQGCSRGLMRDAHVGPTRTLQARGHSRYVTEEPGLASGTLHFRAECSKVKFPPFS